MFVSVIIFIEKAYVSYGLSVAVSKAAFKKLQTFL